MAAKPDYKVLRQLPPDFCPTRHWKTILSEPSEIPYQPWHPSLEQAP